MSDAVWLALIGVVVMVLKEYFDRQRALDAAAKLKEQSAATAARVAEVKTTLAGAQTATEAKLNEIAKTGEKTHALVNSAMGEQKRLLMIKCQAMADKTGDPVDIAEAKEAERAYREHDAGQAEADKNEGKK